MPSIKLTTPLPGPRSQELLRRREGAISASLTRSTDVVIDHANGALVHDLDGNTFIDLAGGIGALAVGHSPAAVVDAIREQAARLIHTSAVVATYEPMVALCEILNEITPGDFSKKSLLANSGSEGVENAIKLARAHTGRPAVVVFEGGYHGRTLLTATMSSKYALYKKSFGPFAPEVYRFPAPYPYRAPAGLQGEAYLDWCLDRLDHAFIAQVDPSEVAAVCIEPVQGEGGFIPMPDRFLHRIRELCDQHGMVMICDEVQSGFGRTGKLFAVEHHEIVPDLIVTAKSLGAGMPVAAVTGRAEILDSPHRGGVGGTYNGNPVACAAAVVTVRMIRRPGFLERATAIGERIAGHLSRWREEIPLVGDARGLGAMQLVELVQDRDSKKPAPQEAMEVIRQSLSGGVMVIRAGLLGNCIRFLPPLVITDEQIDESMAVVEAALKEVGSRLRN